ncbi:MAG TPA: hypothetical protein VJ583_11100 [Nitrososphaeraceae archaeon]|nr:hypothetical protein [Nitrososphaeraceae archaeon]
MNKPAIIIFLMASIGMLVSLSTSINNFSNVMAFENDNDYFNQKVSAEEVVIKKANLDERNELVVVSNINLQNIPKIGMLKVVGVINGEGFIKDLPLDEVDETTNKLKVNFVMNKDNEFVSASKPDEFFVCAYHFTNANNNNDEDYYDNDNKINPVYFDDQNNLPTMKYFDCNEADILSTTNPTEANLFKATSLVYDKSKYYHDMYSKSQESSFATIDDEYVTMDDNHYANNNDNDNSVKVKIIVPMEDKKDAQKIKIMAMLKGQIKSEIIDNVQEEFDKIGGYTIERILAFDRNTDMGPIQIGDRFHACVIGQDLNPPEGSECEKRLIKYLDQPNPLAVR